MKPRLPPLPLTDEDVDAWSWALDYLGDTEDDRRDADIMLFAQCQRYGEVRLTDCQVYVDRFPVPYLAPITQPDVGPVGGKMEWYGTVVVAIDGVEYEVGAVIGVPEHARGSCRNAHSGVRPFLSAWYADASDWMSAPANNGTRGLPHALASSQPTPEPSLNEEI